MHKIQLYHNAKDASEKEGVLKSLEKGLSRADLRRWKPVLEWERACILEDDVPYFCLNAGCRDLMGDIHAAPLIPDFLVCSPIEYAGWRMERMSEHDLAMQTAYICSSLKHLDAWEPQKPETEDSYPVEMLSSAEAIREAEEALFQLWEERIPLSGGFLSFFL